MCLNVICPPQAAHTIHDLESVLTDKDGLSLESIAILKAECAWIGEQSLQLRRRAEEDLRLGMRESNPMLISMFT